MFHYQYVNFNFNPGHWSNWGYGILRFNFSIIKVGGSSLAPLVVPSNVSATNFACDVSSTSTSNSTFTGSTYSASCPMIMGPNGLEFISISLTDNQQNEQGIYRITMGSLLTFEKIEDVTLDTSSTNNAINNQTQNDNNNTQNIISNKQDLINNQNQNTQDIINNQNSNTDKEIESQKVCTTYDKSSGIQQGYFNSNGTINTSSASSDYVITDFINVTSAKLEALTSGGPNVRTCFFNTNKSFISCINTISVGELTIPFDATYVRFSIQKSNNRPTFKICQNGNQAIVNSQQEINNTINNDNVDSQQASDFFSNFQTDSHGLSGIITSPLRLIESLSSSQCSPLVLPLPFVNQSATIPCMSTVYSKFPTFYNLWQLITTGMIAYYILIKLFGHVKGMQDPNDDRIEVLNL